jgi:hypothetical protein
VLDEFPDYMTPTLVAHAVLGAHLHFASNVQYQTWLQHSFKKCVVRVNRREFDKIAQLPNVYLAHENNTLNGIKSCAVPLPCHNDSIPKVLKFAKLWKPIQEPKTEPKIEEERKHIGYTEREEGFYKLYAPPSGAIVTQAFILCKYCDGAIYHCSGPKWDAVCFTCYERGFDK